MLDDLKPHIADLRKRLINSVIALVIGFFVCFFFYEPILEWMMVPVEAVLPPNSQMVAVEVQETFFTALKVAFFSGFILTLPIIFWQVWLFLAPGLYDHEKKLVFPFVFFGTLMFLIGGAFAYYVVIPYGFEFLINFGSAVVTVLPSIGKYVGFFTKLLFGFGVAFELPVITFFLAKIGLVTDRMLKDYFKYAVVIIFIVASLLTPPDVLTQFLMAGPLIILYIVSIYIAKVFNPETDLDEDDDEDEEDDEDEDNEKK
ncbi:twin-arginine translocase subunit TatC [Malaciobacter molluscorum LMG 25693]|uniref:Sec-independent protein translocase protein TatC n=1 Tax=Malaciobacter molluscorum LMG 25693 TaxID=870501 RepID=A0A2G1DKG1_9BACT|nr:twin-arginine translocase subunit TatC [Malaciobacter molluscorum]AXX92557.1 twin arginine translocation system, TatC protein [Malaciobacter molluscorum LMG 25693]PHO18982.1 twin-arginine translocase subunit TatC [Malaciobacter molluscorum LMG 25693]